MTTYTIAEAFAECNPVGKPETESEWLDVVRQVGESETARLMFARLLAPNPALISVMAMSPDMRYNILGLMQWSAAIGFQAGKLYGRSELMREIAGGGDLDQ